MGRIKHKVQVIEEIVLDVAEIRTQKEMDKLQLGQLAFVNGLLSVFRRKFDGRYEFIYSDGIIEDRINSFVLKKDELRFTKRGRIEAPFLSVYYERNGETRVAGLDGEDRLKIDDGESYRECKSLLIDSKLARAA